MKKVKANFWRSPALAKTFAESEKAMSGTRSRTKGLAFEREVAIMLRGLFPRARRWLENHPDDAKGIDLAHTGCFKIQCKRLKNYAPIGRIKEVQCDQQLGDIPMLITAANGEPAMAVLPFRDFLWIIRHAAKAYDFGA